MIVKALQTRSLKLCGVDEVASNAACQALRLKCPRSRASRRSLFQLSFLQHISPRRIYSTSSSLFPFSYSFFIIIISLLAILLLSAIPRAIVLGAFCEQIFVSNPTTRVRHGGLQSRAGTPTNDAHQPVRAPSAESDEDYDPSNLVTDTTTYDPQTAPSIISPVAEQTSQVPSRTESRVSNNKPLPAAAVKQPRIKGGFAVDDSSDEEGTPVTRPATAGSNGHLNVAQAASQPAQTSLPQSSNNSTPLPNVPINSAAQDQGVTGVVSPTSASLTVPTPANVPSIDTGAPTPTAKPSQPHPSPSKESASAATPISATASAPPKARLPNDRVGILEDRIADDPRGDMDAWLELINEHRKRNKIPEARAVYDRFFELFPHAVSRMNISFSVIELTMVQADQWATYAKMEADADNFFELEGIFRRSLMNVPHVKLWSIYLDYIRRRNNLTTDTSGTARQTISAAFSFVLDNVGIDRDSGHLWQEYIEFIKSGPGIVGGTSWQDQQKMDQLRKAYQRAVVVPHHATNTIWTEYSKFEMELNKVTVSHNCTITSSFALTAFRAANSYRRSLQTLCKRGAQQ